METGPESATSEQQSESGGRPPRLNLVTVGQRGRRSVALGGEEWDVAPATRAGEPQAGDEAPGDTDAVVTCPCSTNDL